MKLIVKYFPEITIKSKPVRRQWVRLLQTNIRSTLAPLDPGVRVSRAWDHLIIDTATDEPNTLEAIIVALQRTAGIAWFADVAVFEFDSLDDVLQHTMELWGDALAHKSFVVRCKRVGTHDFTSQDVERYVGGGLLHYTDARAVDLHHPDIKVQLEIRQRQLFIVHQRHEGPGGFPLGAVEPALSLISGGFDSTVASYLCMRRGMRTHFCFFNLGGREHELGVKEVAYFLWQRYGAQRPVQFVTVPFEPVVAEILKQVHHSQMGVILKRMMLRAASDVAAQLRLKALVTGESVAQVSSQTLTNLGVIDRATDALVIRPLIAHDKSDIIRIAEDIGSATFAAHMPEYCGVISVKPTTRARIERIEAEEAKFDFSVLAAAVETARIESIDALTLTPVQGPEAEVLPVPVPGGEIIDIRTADERERKPLILSGTPVRAIPFYELHRRAAEFDPDTTYLLYCDRGVMSRLHANHLVEEGYTNIKVYRPD